MRRTPAPSSASEWPWGAASSSVTSCCVCARAQARRVLVRLAPRGVLPSRHDVIRSGSRPLARDHAHQVAQGTQRATRALRHHLGHRDRRPLHAPLTAPTWRRRGAGLPGRVPLHPRRPARRCTAAGSGRCASTPASAPPARPTSASATCSSRARPGLSVAFDLPTQMGYDSDARFAAGEVGRVGRGHRLPRRHARSCSTTSRWTRSRPR